MSRRESDFRRRMVASSRPLFAIAETVHRWGMGVQIDGMKIRPSFEERSSYTDSGDMKIIKQSGETLLAQVKGRTNLVFNSVDEYPYQDVFLYSASCSAPEPDLVFIVNHDCTYALVITLVDNQENIRTVKTHDPKRGYSYDVLCIDKKYATGFPLV